MKIGIISDTHYPHKLQQMPDKLKEIFSDVQLILHAGDIHDPEVLSWLSQIAPVIAVAGNGDDYQLVETLGYARSIYILGYHIGLTHGHQGHPKADFSLRALHRFPDADIVICGHTHKPYWQQHDDGRYQLNPGSLGVPAEGLAPSVAILELTPDRKSVV